jgi:hypothetical protein
MEAQGTLAVRQGLGYFTPGVMEVSEALKGLPETGIGAERLVEKNPLLPFPDRRQQKRDKHQSVVKDWRASVMA